MARARTRRVARVAVAGTAGSSGLAIHFLLSFAPAVVFFQTVARCPHGDMGSVLGARAAGV